MKKLLLQLVVVGIVSAACDDGSPPPPPPPPPPTTTIQPPLPDFCICNDPGHPDACDINTPRERRPSCSYLTLSTAMRAMIELEETDVIWFGRNFAHAADSRFCDPTLPPFEISRGELLALSEEGHILHDGGREIGLTDTVGDPSRLYFIENLTKENSRYPGRSKIYKPKWNPWKEMFDVYVVIASEVDGRSPNHDGIRHWCADQFKNRPFLYGLVRF